MSSTPPERVLTSREVFRGRILTLKVKQVVLASGRETTREIVEHPGAVVIVAPNAQGDVAMVRQYRSAVGRFLLEVPAGTREAGENADDCAKRELREEMGLNASRWFPLVEFYSAPGFCNELLSVFVATDHSPAREQPEEDETIERIWLSLATVPKAIADGDIVDAKSIASLLTYLQLDQSRSARWHA
jgi:ADP-ribose pyrophosphatase